MKKISYDSEVNVLNIKLNKSKIVDSDMFGDCIVDYDSKGNIINIEILNVKLDEIKKE